jgi:hypothetical protein
VKILGTRAGVVVRHEISEGTKVENEVLSAFGRLALKLSRSCVISYVGTRRCRVAAIVYIIPRVVDSSLAIAIS